ncbi:hypothetical protein A9G41_04215 [Gilliamella sp. Nev5-1]|uniref:hypothetical protein n=1 Tax=Gilliamella sp. Nev5-1 TaxID=3120251 RepID=UPI00080DC964|nr:hypothetical protein [Gilliamella apicola]OCG56950.1 hypothetical protein A9G30_01870 [Gilliamella apicola]OCG70831.1 hypothetical protein A9G41_04215 [Gilliamella apicola]
MWLKGKWRPYEITSKTASKHKQLAKEARIHSTGSIYVKNKNTNELIEIESISKVIRQNNE